MYYELIVIRFSWRRRTSPEPRTAPFPSPPRGFAGGPRAHLEDARVAEEYQRHVCGQIQTHSGRAPRHRAPNGDVAPADAAGRGARLGRREEPGGRALARSRRPEGAELAGAHSRPRRNHHGVRREEAAAAPWRAVQSDLGVARTVWRDRRAVSRHRP